MHVRRRLSGAAVLAAFLVALAVPASAATPNAHGYWWRLQKSGPALPKPPVVPSDGLWVASDASGQLAVSAVRYRAPSGVEIRSLVLRVARSSGQGAVVLACPAGARWQPAEAGAWSERPKTSCDVAFVKGVGSADGSSWSFDVRGLARSGTLDVVILPPPDVRDTFSISFEQPSSSSIVTQRLPGSPSPSSSASAEESPHAARVTQPTRVLGAQTTPPVAPLPSASPQGYSPMPPPVSAPTGLLAGGDLEDTSGRGTVIGVAAGLAILALAGLAGRALLQHSQRSLS